MTTTHQLLAANQIPADLVHDLEIPVLTGPQRQGDLLIWPTRPGAGSPGDPVPADGVPVVRGEAGGNTHLLVAVDAPVYWRSVQTSGRAGGVDLGTVTVPSGSTAALLHPEHGGNMIGPGSYTIRRQVEQADQIRLVQD
jgi:hypothetical protein